MHFRVSGCMHGYVHKQTETPDSCVSVCALIVFILQACLHVFVCVCVCVCVCACTRTPVWGKKRNTKGVVNIFGKRRKSMFPMKTGRHREFEQIWGPALEMCELLFTFATINKCLNSWAASLVWYQSDSPVLN